ncbi:hypothetical protein ZIOFF_075042 [Zingiber officinale]|uniref:XPG-I domain-containing protein n=1 Tax=Zingiber officinale TaxID=94328 RepID=A0A8J5BXN1_ZINOF|nr:hypothetical protein ZIOFF_075042 [Zingiber officinale]
MEQSLNGRPSPKAANRRGPSTSSPSSFLSAVTVDDEEEKDSDGEEQRRGSAVKAAKRLSLSFEMSHVLGALLISSPLLAQAWTCCLRANAGSANFVIDRSDDAVFITFSGTQAVASSSGLGRGFLELVSLYSNTHDIFTPLGRGEEDDDGKPQPMLLQASSLRLFMSLYHTSEFQIREEHENIRLFRMMAPKPLDYELLNENVKKVAYAVKGELYLRASELQKEGKKTGDLEGIEKYNKRTVKNLIPVDDCRVFSQVTKPHNEDCKRLLRLMGVPTIEAPCEAEAQSAALCKSDKVFAVASENMDTLTFGVPRCLHHLMDPSSKKISVMEFDVSKVLEELRLTMDQFIDLCILSGCDYCDNIKGRAIREA